MSKKKPSTPSSGSQNVPVGRIRKNTPPMTNLDEFSPKEQDERYCYLLKFGKVKKNIDNGSMIFAELSQIPGIWICYRKPKEREANPEKIQLDSLELDHLPLMEGEEKLKILSFQHNKIKKIENLVSLPNLLYLDFLDNKINIVENLDNLPNLRILLMPQNMVSEIKSLEKLTKLEVLDLHSNRIKKVEGLKNLKSLKILNLADNLIEKMEGMEDLESLEELNLKMNKIENCTNFGFLKKLQKLFLCENKIKDPDGLQYINTLLEIALDGNEICSIMKNYVENMFELIPSLKILDHKEKELYFKEKETEIAEKKALQEKKLTKNQILEIIKEQWEKELGKMRKFNGKFENAKQEKELFSLDSGHAEIDSDTSLLIYGNAFKVVLFDEKHHSKIKKILFKYVLFDHLMQGVTFEALLKFSQLEEITFSDNYLTSLIQISKLEQLPNLKILEISCNPICDSTILKDFIIYRFPKIEKINDVIVDEFESDVNRKKSRILFENFDKILQLPEKTPKAELWVKKLTEYRKKPQSNNKSSSTKQLNKIINEASEKFLSGVLIEIHEEKRLEMEFERCWNGYLENLIKQI